MKAIAKFFGWWNDVTPGTWFSILKSKSRQIGTDEFGNRFFEESGNSSADGLPRRFVVYNGYAEASAVPATWHSWLHHMSDLPPNSVKDASYKWEKAHRPNLTGTLYSSRPKGSMVDAQTRQKSTSDYESWTPKAEEN